MGKKIVKWLKEKDRILFEVGGVHLFDSADYAEMLDKSDDFDDVFFETLLKSDHVADAGLCPWCLEYYKYIGVRLTCPDCKYGKRNGICGESNSIYDDVVTSLKSESLSVILIEAGFIKGDIQ